MTAPALAATAAAHEEAPRAGQGSRGEVPTPNREQNATMIAPASDVCDRLAVHLRTAAVWHTLAAAGLDSHALDLAAAPDLGTRDFTRLALEVDVAPSELAGRAERMVDGYADGFPAALAAVLRTAAVRSVALAAGVNPDALDGDGQDLTCADVDALAAVLDLDANELVRAARLPAPMPDEPAWCTVVHAGWDPQGAGEHEIVHRASVRGIGAIQSVFLEADGSVVVAGVDVDLGGDIVADTAAEAAADLRRLASDALELAAALDPQP